MSSSPDTSSSSPSGSSLPLSLEEYKRYGRQMIMPGWGLPGQLKLKNAKVAVVGAGGLGCPVLQYLAGAGVGTIAIFDHDTVSISNLHRQILHTTDRVGLNKSESAKISLEALNPHINIHPFPHSITSQNALSALRPYDIIIDCTDQPITRYILSDASVILDVPLISGGAISSAGQWAVYGGYIARPLQAKQDGTSGSKDIVRHSSIQSQQKGMKEGMEEQGVDGDGRGDVRRERRACYRCLWPSVVGGDGGLGRCDELGVWNVIVGMVGVGMAGEVIKLILGQDDQQPLLHLLHLGGNPLIRTIKMRKPRKDCIACGEIASIRDNLDNVDYEAFCAGVNAEADDEREGEAIERISVKDFARLRDEGTLGVVVDTRPEVEFGICSLSSTTNVPFPSILADPTSSVSDGSGDITFLCRRGNDSLIAARVLKAAGYSGRIRDVQGGIEAWSRDVDPSFPLY